MNLINGNAAVSCYVDLASLLVLLLLLILSERVSLRDNMSVKIYRLLCLESAFTCVVCFMFSAMEGYTSTLSHVVAMISRTAWEICILFADIIWLRYVEVKLYGYKKKRSLRHLLRICIVILYVVILTVNIFTGISFTLNKDNTIQRRPLNTIMLVVDFLIFLSSALEIWNYGRKSLKVSFVRITPMVIPMLIAVLPQFFTPYNLGILGYATGAIFLYISLISELRFYDGESGLYNKEFITYLFDLAIVQRDFIHSALILELDGNVKEGLKIIKEKLHNKGDVMRIEQNKCLMFSRASTLPVIQNYLNPVEEAIDGFNAEHPKESIKLTARSRIRDEEETSFDFIHSSLEDNEEGSEMHGIVSMIDELDRLDKELTMAADIQRNNLPMTFPERKEFDLFASMTPAKEVGGDFYDFFFVDDDHLALVIADVSGKGIPAALFMMVSKTLIKNSLTSGCGPAQALEKTNNQLCEHNTSMMFVTIWLAVLELSTGKGIECNAGHEKPAIYRKGESFELLDYEHDVIAGVIQDLEYHGREFELKPGDVLFVYTDGLPEATNYDEEQFGEKRLVDALNMNAMAGPKELIPFVHEKVNEFVGSAPQFDDLTMLCLRYYGP